jgi:hypothetical protein
VIFSRQDERKGFGEDAKIMSRPHSEPRASRQQSARFGEVAADEHYCRRAHPGKLGLSERFHGIARPVSTGKRGLARRRAGTWCGRFAVVDELVCVAEKKRSWHRHSRCFAASGSTRSGNTSDRLARVATVASRGRTRSPESGRLVLDNRWSYCRHPENRGERSSGGWGFAQLSWRG